MLVIASGLAALAAVAAAPAAAAPPPARDAAYVVRLDKSLPKESALQLHLAVRDGAITAGFAAAPAFNRVVHDLDCAGLRWEDGRLKGQAQGVLHADLYTPADGKPVPYRVDVDCASADDGSIAGTYRGTVGSQACAGTVSGSREPHFDPSAGYARFRVHFLAALERLFRQRGANYKYALDMVLTFPVRSGSIGPLQFETTVPDYRRYCALVESHDLRFERDALAGTVTVLVDYGEQGSAKDFPKRDERYVYTLRAAVIGGTIGGAWDARFGDAEVKGRRFLGTVQRDPPPAPADSIAFLRLHKAMHEDFPVILILGLADDGLLNGYAWCPGYNHQPHAVDATGLRRNGNTLEGDVTVTIAPDCFKPPETFAMRFRLRAAIDGAEIVGKFEGHDGRKDVRGAVTGELRPKRRAPRPVTPDAIARCRIHLGYALVGGAKPPPALEKRRPLHADIVFSLKGGRPEKVDVVNPEGAPVFEAAVRASDLRIEGDRVTGFVEFDLRSETVKPGRYRYSFEAIVDGAECVGFWRGALDDKPIYTKSAKLGGRFEWPE
jgi:hypothetical protein